MVYICIPKPWKLDGSSKIINILKLYRNKLNVFLEQFHKICIENLIKSLL